MKQFIHHKIQKIDLLLQTYNSVRQLYVNNSFEFFDEYKNLLDECKEFLQVHGTNSQVAEVLNLESFFEIAKKGINPYELIKVNSGKRGMIMMTANQGLNDLLFILKSFYEKENNKIEVSSEILSNMLLGLIQSGGLEDDKLIELNTIQKIETFWNKIRYLNKSVNLIDKQLKVNIISEDIYLIIEGLLNKMR